MYIKAYYHENLVQKLVNGGRAVSWTSINSARNVQDNTAVRFAKSLPKCVKSSPEKEDQ
ncbi:hypothetical protein Hanom_Chr02g00099801 [Helianthus anomalus]